MPARVRDRLCGVDRKEVDEVPGDEQDQHARGHRTPVRHPAPAPAEPGRAPDPLPGPHDLLLLRGRLRVLPVPDCGDDGDSRRVRMPAPGSGTARGGPGPASSRDSTRRGAGCEARCRTGGPRTRSATCCAAARTGLLFLGMGGDQRGVEIQDQVGKFSSAGPGSRYALAGLAACSQATSQAEPRAARSEASAASSVSASNRQAVVVEATGLNTPAWSRSTARSATASPPSASITARSVATRPGSRPVPRGRDDLRAAEYATVSPVTSARSASNRAPACPTTPAPSALTWTLGRNPIPCT